MIQNGNCKITSFFYNKSNSSQKVTNSDNSPTFNIRKQPNLFEIEDHK